MYHYEKVWPAGSYLATGAGCGHQHSLLDEAAACQTVATARYLILPPKIEPKHLPAIFTVRTGPDGGQAILSMEMSKADLEKWPEKPAPMPWESSPAAIKVKTDAAMDAMPKPGDVIQIAGEPHKIVTISPSDHVHYELLRRAVGPYLATGCGHAHEAPLEAARCPGHHDRHYEIRHLGAVALPAVFKVHRDSAGETTGLDLEIDNLAWQSYMNTAVTSPDAKTMIDAFRAIEQGKDDDDDDLPRGISRLISV